MAPAVRSPHPATLARAANVAQRAAASTGSGGDKKDEKKPAPSTNPYVWVKEKWHWAGYQSTAVAKATIKQKGDTCWAASLAIATTILGYATSDDFWIETAQTHNLAQAGKAISSAWWLELGKVLPDVLDGSFSAASRDDATPQSMFAVLSKGSVVLLHSKDHIVVLSALAFNEDAYDSVKLRVTDPAPGEYTTWDESDLKKFGLTWITIVTRKGR